MTKSNINSSTSGYLFDSFEGISRDFTDVEVLFTSEVNVMAKGKRYGRWWALKALNPVVAAQVAFQQRLRKEFEILMQMEHPGVVNVVGLESVDGLGECIVMEYIDGKTLSDWIGDNPDRSRKRKVASDLTAILIYIHSKHIVHRDLKPENIMVSNNGDAVKLIDFGLADTDSHAVLKQPAGTIGYMSPEQLQNPYPDVRNDIYSLGKIFALMDIGYSKIIKKCLHPIDFRYQNMTLLKADIEKRNKRGLRLGITAIIVIMTLLAGGFVWQTFRIGEFENISTSDIEQRELLQHDVAVLTDSLNRINTSYAMIKEEQNKQQSQRQRIEKAIADGCTLADKALAKTQLLNIIDTLKYKDYGFETLANGGASVNNAVNEYLAQQREHFSVTEMAEITNAVYTHTTNILKPVSDKISSLPWLNY